MIIEFKPAKTYFSENTAPVLPPVPLYEEPVYDEIEEDEREYCRMMRTNHIRTAVAIIFIVLIIFAALNIRVAFIYDNPVIQSANGQIVLFVRCFNTPKPGDIMMTEYDFSNPEFSTVSSVMNNGFIKFGEHYTDNQMPVYDTMHKTEAFYTLCIIPLQ